MAACQGGSRQEVIRRAVIDYWHRRERVALIDEVLDEELPRYKDALDRLSQ